MQFWITSWSMKEETCWETCLENMAAELMPLGIMGTCLTTHGLVGDAWNAEQSPGMLSDGLLLFLKDGTSCWYILKLAWFGKAGQDYVFSGCFKGSGS